MDPELPGADGWARPDAGGLERRAGQPRRRPPGAGAQI
jgi:hypothetical protein